MWSWLVLCDDGTVISIHEPLTSISPQDLRKVRTNMLTVFRSLSASSAATSLSSVSIGAGLDDLPFRVPNTESDTVDGGPSLLLYYLFDDWYSTFRFVYERGAPYSTKMSKLRNSMRKDPHLKHLKKLHRITRRLASLKRMMETRKIILENILYRQEKPSASGGGADPGFMGGGGGGAGSVGIGSPGFFPPTVENSIDNLQLFHQQHLLQQQLQQQQQQQQQAAQQTQHQPFRRPSEASPYPHPYPHPRPLALTSMGSPHLLGVRLSPLSITKFERLRDRIRLYVLGELDSLLVEKTELENLTFNLISLKQSQTVEVLTRITIYLTKFTFLFLPLTLVTGYFSMQVREMQDGQRYGVSAFWGAAAVSVVVTLAIIWLVGRKTEETMELGKVWRGVRGWVRRKVGRGGGEERRRR